MYIHITYNKYNTHKKEMLRMDAMKNREKIDWDSHSIDFNADYSINGGYSIDTYSNEVLLELYSNESEYDDDEIKRAVRKAVNAFLNLRNKKVVCDGTTFERKLGLYNDSTDEVDELVFTFYVTYNP